MIGRAKEQQVLKNLALSGEAEFVVVYGRRRVGKTYLVRETFENTFFFSYTGIARVSAGKQIARFENTLRTYGWSGHRIRTWFDAFGALRELIAAGSKDEPLIVFIDEMPWMDNKKSDFISAFEHFALLERMGIRSKEPHLDCLRVSNLLDYQKDIQKQRRAL